MKAHGIEPAPERKRQTTWKTFLQSHWDVLGAIDFTTIDSADEVGSSQGEVKRRERLGGTLRYYDRAAA